MRIVSENYTMTVKKAIKALENLIEYKEEKAKDILDPQQSWNKDYKENDLPHKVAETISELMY